MLKNPMALIKKLPTMMSVVKTMNKMPNPILATEAEKMSKSHSVSRPLCQSLLKMLSGDCMRRMNDLKVTWPITVLRDMRSFLICVSKPGWPSMGAADGSLISLYASS